MPRNSSGTYSLYTPGNPVVTNTVISSTWANNTLADLASAVTDSLSRSGDGGMLAPLELDNGAIGAPALTWATETTSGLYRNAAGDFRFSVSASDKLTITSTGLSVAGSIITSTATGGSQGAGTINATAVYDDGVLLANAVAANPTASVGLAAANGSAGTFMRSDAAPALSQAIAPTWTGLHKFARPASSEKFRLIASDSAGDAYFTFYENDDTTRKGYIGYGAAADDRFFIANEENAAMLFITNASTRVTIAAGGDVTYTGVQLGPNGSASAPTWSFSGDTNTGIYWNAADDIYMAMGGTGYPIGYRGMPSRTITTSDSTAATDNGRAILFTGAGSQTFTVDSDFGVANFMCVILNGGTGSLSVAESLSGTMTWLNGSGTLSTGTRTLAIGGVCTIWMVDANNAYIWGTGLS